VPNSLFLQREGHQNMFRDSFQMLLESFLKPSKRFNVRAILITGSYFCGIFMSGDFLYGSYLNGDWLTL